MIFLGNLLIGIGQVLSSFLTFFSLIVLIAVILSWFRVYPSNRIVSFIYNIAETLYQIPRRYMRTTFGPVDIAPIIVILGITLLQTVVVSSMLDYGQMIRVQSMRSVNYGGAAVPPPGVKGRSL